MKSKVLSTNTINLPLIKGEYSMIPFDLITLKGLPREFLEIAKNMLKGIEHSGGISFFTIHGKVLKKGDTLRRGGPHTDGNYEPHFMTFGSGGGNGWKVGESGPETNTELHDRQYNNDKGGIIIASNFESCIGWLGEFEGTPNKGGDCSHIKLNEGFKLKKNRVYYGNNHFIHESLAVSDDIHRVMARITMPENHVYKVTTHD
jgi:hypothetical protein